MKALGEPGAFDILKDGDLLFRKEWKLEKMKTIRVVAAIIRDGNKIFATQRGYGEYKDGWEFPGGKIEAGETPQEALAREIKEELNITIEVGRLIDTIESGELVLKEHEAAKWLTMEQLDSVDWLPADRVLVGKICDMEE